MASNVGVLIENSETSRRRVPRKSWQLRTEEYRSLQGPFLLQPENSLAWSRICSIGSGKSSNMWLKKYNAKWELPLESMLQSSLILSIFQVVSPQKVFLWSHSRANGIFLILGLYWMSVYILHIYVYREREYIYIYNYYIYYITANQIQLIVFCRSGDDPQMTMLASCVHPSPAASSREIGPNQPHCAKPLHQRLTAKWAPDVIQENIAI